MAEKRTPEDSMIEGNETMLSAYDKIRSCDDVRFPAFFIVEGEKVFIKLFRSDETIRKNKFDI